jgi:hypothetical protein
MGEVKKKVVPSLQSSKIFKILIIFLFVSIFLMILQSMAIAVSMVMPEGNPP